MAYAKVIVELTAASLERPYTYRVPGALEHKVRTGSVVAIPFGAGNRTIRGTVVAMEEHADIPLEKVKDIQDVHDKVDLESQLILLGHWMKERYVCSLQAAFNAILPARTDVSARKESRVRLLLDPEALTEALASVRGNATLAKRAGVLEMLLEGEVRIPPEGVPSRRFLAQARTTQGVLQGLVKAGVLALSQVDTGEMPVPPREAPVERPLPLHPAQEAGLHRILDAVEAGRPDTFLLHGITGSGKTEVYLQAIGRVLELGKEAIVLIPEIALTPQTIGRFVERFGNVVGVMHSRLSPREKMDQWQKARSGEVRVMVGPRSAVFTPFPHLGMIVLDEEHEMSYKSEQVPKYHAREVAIKRSLMGGFPVVLGSATPLVESYHKALEGQYTLLTLEDKAVSGPDLEVEVVDMRQELLEGNKGILSKPLQEAMAGALERKEQVLLFLNRRGYAQAVSCRQCGHVMKCPSCDLPYTYHAEGRRLLCHHCGSSVKSPESCPSCGSVYIKAFGIGTQKVEKQVQKMFPQARVVRMDLDTTSTKDGHARILGEFSQGRADILVGTQMVAKGHHFENVTVVGVVAADMSLFMNDFRNSERTFQLVTQVTGRTGRGAKGGRAFIQTYSPGHFSIQAAREQDYGKFYRQEVLYRKMMGYPPFSNLLVLLFSSTDEKALVQGSRSLAGEMEALLESLDPKLLREQEVQMIGPAPANLSKVRDMYRQRLMVKARTYKFLTYLIKEFYNRMQADEKYKPLRVAFDINPMVSQ
ncbi:replication restart helicase PriA [Anaerotalea alkaliphila]|uniref:Replication restart protein PriA n=1 Tax=Anaerotalea alkaliphila TaxID=2662126 RepID=A0A7X5HUI5_9FIRM|nr:primosomal protein N' [Anaerotalea alkaliphila]NDL66893.1 primosomal protein N' [Anaerotalea alkaliphila]